MYCLLFSDCFLFTIHFLTAIHIEYFINVGVVSFILKYLLSRQRLKLYFYHNLFSLIRSDLEIQETRNISERNRRFGASCAIIKVT